MMQIPSTDTTRRREPAQKRRAEPKAWAGRSRSARMLLLPLATLCWHGPSLAQAEGAAGQAAPVQDVSGDHILAFGGGEINFADSGFVGAMIPLPSARIGNGFAVRGSGFGGDYSYESSGSKINGTFYGGQVEGVYQFSGSGFWFDVGAGGRYVDTHLTPFDASNRRHGAQGEFEVSVDGGAVRGPWRTDYYGSYGTRLDDYAGRISLTHAITDKFRVGAEVGAEGDPTYDLQRVGPYVGYAFNRRSELQMTVGVSRQSGEGEGGYLRVLYYHSF